MAEEMKMVLTLKKWRRGTYCQPDPVTNMSEEQERGRQGLNGRRDGNGAHTEEIAMWDLLPIRSSLKA